MAFRYGDQWQYNHTGDHSHRHTHLSSLERVDSNPNDFPRCPNVYKLPSYAKDQGYINVSRYSGVYKSPSYVEDQGFSSPMYSSVHMAPGYVEGQGYIPRYPSVFKAPSYAEHQGYISRDLNVNKAPSYDEDQGYISRDLNVHDKVPSYAEEGYVSSPRKDHRAKVAHHKVTFEEPSVGVVKKAQEKHVHENVDEEADDFIQSRHKRFGLSSWDTFKN